MDNDLRDRLRGVAVGAAVGDALGMPLEFGPPSPADNLVRAMLPGRLPAGAFTDDTEMALGIVEVLTAHGRIHQDELARAKAHIEARRHELDAAHRTVQQQVASAWDRLLAATAAIVALRAEVRANDIALQGVQEENLVGARTVLDVLDAEQELFSSRVNLVRAERDEILASFQLKAAIGELTTEGLGLPVERYDAERNYRVTRARLMGLQIDPPPALQRTTPAARPIGASQTGTR